MMYAALCCIYKNILFGSGKLKFLVFQIPSHKNKNKKERTTLPSSPFRGTTKNYEKKNEKTNCYSILSMDMIRYSHVSRPYICLHSSRDLTLHSCLRNFPSLQYSSRYSNTMCTIFFIFVFIIYTTNIVPNSYDWQKQKMLRLHQPAKGILRNFPIL